MKILKLAGAAVLVMIIGAALYLKTPITRKYDTEQIKAAAKNYDVRILRDNWGVAHIYGKRDADTSFGLAYSHAEDNWTYLERSIIVSRGEQAAYYGKANATQDYLNDLFKIRNLVSENIKTDVTPEALALAQAYADGMNLWGVENPDRVNPNILPVTSEDIIAGITWASPFFYGFDGVIGELFNDTKEPEFDDWKRIASTMNYPLEQRGSNSFAIAPQFSDDNKSRLIVNSHQPMEGLYAWYEARIVSEDGYEMIGGTFPGLPVLVQGFNPDLGWAHTVNYPDLVDAYKLETNDEEKPTQYKLDGQWVDFEITKSKFRVKLWGPFSLPVNRDIYWSKHGPAIKTPHGFYAVRFAGLGEVGQLDQWYKMGKSRTLAEWRKAVAQNGILSLNMIYADKEGNIGQVYNALMPKRIDGPNWLKVLPGDNSELIWTEFEDHAKMPQLFNPPSGWIVNANSTPFQITSPADNMKRDDYPERFGIEKFVTNRTLRGVELLSQQNQLSREKLLEIRADVTYHEDSKTVKLIKEVLALNFDDLELQAAQEILAGWDYSSEIESKGAPLAILTAQKAISNPQNKGSMPPEDAFRESVEELKRIFGRVDLVWGDVTKIRRGDLELPLRGSPDVLRAVNLKIDTLEEDGAFVADNGDTHIIVGEWDQQGRLSVDSIIQYGAQIEDPNKPHYNDQMPLFVEGKFKRIPLTLESVEKVAERDYRPGQ